MFNSNYSCSFRDSYCPSASICNPFLIASIASNCFFCLVIYLLDIFKMPIAGEFSSTSKTIFFSSI